MASMPTRHPVDVKIESESGFLSPLAEDSVWVPTLDEFCQMKRLGFISGMCGVHFPFTVLCFHVPFLFFRLLAISFSLAVNVPNILPVSNATELSSGAIPSSIDKHTFKVKDE